MNNVEIIRVTLSDIRQLQEISSHTFFETFSETNTEEDMRKYMDEGFSIDNLTKQLTDKNSEFYFALFDSTVIGYIKLNFGESQTDLKDNNAVEIERIYVLKDFHGKSVGQILYNTAIEIANQRQKDYIWLGVWEKNPRAISFYKKNGFVKFDKHIFVLGNDAQTDIMMKLNLRHS